MTTYSTISKNTTTYGAVNRGDLLTNQGIPIGLLLVLTYAGTNSFTTYGTATKHTTSYSTINKN